jgi:small subunit ribosomal protein S6
MYIVSPEVEEENLETLTTKVEQMITDGGGETLRLQSWGRRRLAYPIRNFREGHYILVHLQLEPAAISELKSKLALTEEVIRYLLIRTDEIPAPVAPKEPTRAEQAEEMQVEEPAEESSEEPAEEPSEEPAEEPSEESAEEPSEEPAEEPSEEPVEELTEPEAASDRDSEDTDQQEVGE